MLAHLITEPELSVAGPLDASLDPALEPDGGTGVASASRAARSEARREAISSGFLAPLAYEAALGWEDAAWVPARRRPTACRADVLA